MKDKDIKVKRCENPECNGVVISDVSDRMRRKTCVKCDLNAWRETSVYNWEARWNLSGN